MSFSEAPLNFDDQGRIVVSRPINWNYMEDPIDLEVWNKLTSQFWLPEKIPLSSDLKSWHTLTPDEQDATSKVFAGLAGLDSIQGHIGAPSLMLDAKTQHEVAVLANICFMEEVHAKSYSSTNATFLSSEEIEKYWRWFAENEYNQYKIKRMTEFYYGKDVLLKKAASTILESFLFYSGFYLPIHWASIGKMTNTADLIRLILRDESVHSFFVGYKFQVEFNSRTPEEQEHIKNEVYELLMDLYENEVKYTESIYDVLGLTEDVKKFMHYNGNKALQNLGFEALFDKDETDFSKAILSSLTLNSETHDFFSGAGSSYFMAKTEELSDDDWDF